MKTNWSIGKYVILVGFILLGYACSAPPKPKGMSKEELRKGPEQNPFKECHNESEDGECEEGASSDLLQKIPEIQAVVDVPSVATNSTVAKPEG
ncbi:MAG: hypothetical protein Q8L98_04830 [Chlamydiales bacterium]|nr:hypothetical protein [Chlamydiales bacterium]